MSGVLPVISGGEAVSAFQKIGYQVVRQRGSHIRMRHPNNPSRKPLTVPAHKTLKAGLLRKLIRDANLTVEEFSSLL